MAARTAARTSVPSASISRGDPEPALHGRLDGGSVDAGSSGTGTRVRYTRIYSDAEGETHFEDLSPEMVIERYAGAEWLLSEPVAVDRLWFRRVTKEFPDEPHVAPRRQLIVALAGEAEVEVSDGEKRWFGPGCVMLVEDTTGKGHRTRRIGDTPRETLFISLPD